jgi:uncharacterized membrane protein YesL
MNKGILIIFLISLLIVTFFYDYLPINDQLKSLLPRSKIATTFLLWIPLFVFFGFMYYFTTFIHFIIKYFKNNK